MVNAMAKTLLKENKKAKKKKRTRAAKATAALMDYDPHYDPLVMDDPGEGQDYAPTYWVATAGEPPADDGPVTGDMDVDVAIIGSGFTGLSTAIHLAKDHGIKATVLEANRLVWGCTSRNGGQAQNASGRLSRSQWVQRWGLETAQKLHAEIEEGFDVFREMIAGIDCDAQRGGHVYVAHKPSALKRLQAEAELLNTKFDYPCRIIDAETLRREYFDEADAAGAMIEPSGIGIHPLKLAFGYIRMARKLGVKIHPASPVMHWEPRYGRHELRTPAGIVKARAVGVATGGYTSTVLHPLVRKRYMPVLSNSLVTRPLTKAELEACNFRTHLVITDTRTLRHYYRLLPDNRLQIGSRSAITGADATNPAHLQLLIDGLHRKFPALKGIDIDYDWWGWVDVSHDMMPRIFRPFPRQNITYAFGYGGNGVMYSTQAGRRMAQIIAGKRKEIEDLPIFQSALPTHPLAPFRRLGQRMLYHWYYLRDEYL